ncbi:MAG: universal stress protein [Gemmatimonadaceae bacterium]
MYRTIIVPLDGSTRSHAALPVAARLARACGARLVLARVHIDERPDLAHDPSWDAMFREGEQRYLDTLAPAYESTIGQEVETALLDSPVEESLCDFASLRVAPIFVMAGRGRTGLRRALLGSTADGLVRRGIAPVLVLRDRQHEGDAPAWMMRGQPFARILLPLDGTTFAEGGIAHAVVLAKATGAKLHLIRVVGPIMTSAVLGEFMLIPPQPHDESNMLRNDLARDYLDGIVDRIKVSAPMLEVSAEVSLSTDPGSAIVESTRHRASDLIVMASHGRRASRLLVGAVGDRVLRDGPDAILFIRPVKASVPAERRTPTREESLPAAPRVPALARQ